MRSDVKSNQNGQGHLPQGAEASTQIKARQRRGQLWVGVFVAALMISILALGALLYNITNSAVGLVAVESAVTPATIAQRQVKQKMLAMPNTVASEDDMALATGVASDPNAIGFFGYAYYKAEEAKLKALTINGVAPVATNVEDNSYPLSRPLFLYVPQDTLISKPEVTGYIDYYLKNVNRVIEDVGYFPLNPAVMAQSVSALQALVPPQGEAGGYPQNGNIGITGSSTLAPLTVRMADLYRQAGFHGTISVDSSGTRAGFKTLCVDGAADIADASRPLDRYEEQACTTTGRDLIEYPVGLDAVAVVVNPVNTFLASATDAELQAIFTQANKWSDVNPDWPDQPIKRFIPASTSGTLDFFVEKVFADVGLAEMSKEDLLGVLTANASKGVMRRLEREKPMAQRTQEELRVLVVERVVQPKIVASWNFMPSLTQREAIEKAVFVEAPYAELEWRSWVNWNFLTSPQSSNPDTAGVRTAILGTLWVVLIAALFAIPVGVGAAIYLEEYAGQGRINRIIQTNIDNLAGVPSIIYGILGLAVFVRALEVLTSGAILGVVDPTTANGRTVFAAGLTLGLLVLPVVIINSQEAIRAVPKSLREAGYGVGGTKWQVVRSHVLSNALPGIFTGIILAVSRAIGETAPLVVIGAATFIVTDPTSVFSKFTALPMQIYQWTSRPQPEFRHIAAAASIVLLVLLFMMNFAAIYLRNRYSKKY